MDIQFPKLFITGMGRSGTHWLLHLLLQHPQTVGLQTESKLYSVFGDYLGTSSLPPGSGGKMMQIKHKLKRYFEQRFPVPSSQEEAWFSMLDDYNAFEAGTRLKAFVTNDALVEMINRARNEHEALSKAVQSIIDQILAQFYSSQTIDHSKTLVEKTPRHLFYLPHIFDHFSDAKAIILVRDVVGYCESLTALSKQGISWSPSETFQQIQLWKDAAQYTQKLMQSSLYNGKILLVKMENLRHVLSHEMQQILDFASLYSSADILQHIVSKSKEINRSKEEAQLPLSQKLKETMLSETKCERQFLGYA